jgi:hypothetical protein
MMKLLLWELCSLGSFYDARVGQSFVQFCIIEITLSTSANTNKLPVAHLYLTLTSLYI